MKTPIVDRDLAQEPPHSPRDRFGGFAILGRTVDKCRASMAGTLGEYHYDCLLDNQLFNFKGINAAEFQAVVARAKNYKDVARWLKENGTPKTREEIRTWSDKVESLKVKDIPAMQAPDRRKELLESCRKLGLDFGRATFFDWLEADDEVSFQPHSQPVAK